MSHETTAVIAHAARTPFGKYNGLLSEIRPDDLLASLMKSMFLQIPQINPINIDEVIIGDSNGSGEDNRNVARMSTLLAGFPDSVPGVTVNRLCGSGAEAILQAARLIRLGEANLVLAGGVESMSRAPWIVERSIEVPKQPILHQSTIGWRLINTKMSPVWTQSLGLGAENIALDLGINRSQQDAWAFESHQKALASWNSGFHKNWVIPQNDLIMDESIRPDTTLEKLSSLKSAFSNAGSVTAGNSSPINDGAVAAIITSQHKANELNLEPLGILRSSQVVGVSPEKFTTAPIFAISKLLDKNKLRIEDISVWEINEAFAAMVLTVLQSLPRIDPSKVNINGGAIAIGHPIGASAARAVIDCARQLQVHGGGLGIAAACIGVGQGIAVLVEVR